MMKLLLPLLLVVGRGGGVGVGLALVPPTPEAALTDPCGAVADPAADPHAAEAGAEAHAEDASHAEDPEGPGAEAFDYVRLNNQFVVPVLDEGEVASLVMLSLSVEVPTGQEEAVLTVEPKLRDVFLQVLFDHANTGGFAGTFTATTAMRGLRAALLAAAQDEVGDMVSDVLIVELVRQDT